MRERCAILTLVSLVGLTAHGTHIIGGEIFYDHLGQGQYQVTLKLYRDCSGAVFDAQASIGVFDAVTFGLVQSQSLSFPGGTQVPIILDSPCLTLPPNICVEATSYTGIFNLPPSQNGYVLAYQRCCRTGIISNLLNPGDAGLTVTTRIPGVPSAANSSARFNELPPVALCLGAPLEFDHSATDPDQDSLVYSLTTPFDGASFFAPQPAPPAPPPYAPVAWGAGYSAGYPIDSDPAIAIDPATGLLTLTPTVQGNFTVGVMVQEYRQGVLLTETRRDFLFKVVACDAAITAAIVPQPASELCDDLSIAFGNASVGASTWFWDFGVESASDDVSTAQQPSFTFPAPGSYLVTLVANPGSTCADTATALFAVYLPPQPLFTVPDPGCGSPAVRFIARGTFGPDATLAWSFGGGAVPAASNEGTVSVSFPGPGDHPVTLTVLENGCTGVASATVVQYPQPVADFTVMPGTSVPLGTVLSFTDASQAGGGTISAWAWWLDGGLFGSSSPAAQWTADWPGIHNVALVVSNSSGCADTAVATIEVQGEPIVIPNVFSPNGDGLNDRFVVANIQYYSNDFAVYSRWGNKVYEARNYKNEWSGADLPDGTYYYVLKLDDGPEHAGHVTILR